MLGLYIFSCYIFNNFIPFDSSCMYVFLLSANKVFQDALSGFVVILHQFNTLHEMYQVAFTKVLTFQIFPLQSTNKHIIRMVYVSYLEH